MTGITHVDRDWGVSPCIVRLTTTDNLATVAGANYILDQTANITLANNGAFEWLASDMVAVAASDGTDIFRFNGSDFTTLIQLPGGNGSVTLPVVGDDFVVFDGTLGALKDLGFSASDSSKTKVVMAGSAVVVNHIAKFIDTDGTVDDTAGTAINSGNIQAGLSGVAGTLGSFPSAVTSGELLVAAVTNSSGNFNTTISNASAVGQSQVVSIPDGGTATSNFIISNSAGTQTIATGNLTLTAGSLNLTAGNLVAGSSGHAGTVASFPAAAASGELFLAAVTNATGNFNTTISNATAVGQSQVISIPDSGATTANFIISKSAGTQNITSGALQVNAGAITSGLSTGAFVGLIKAFPTTATSGFIAMQAAVNGSGNFGTTISNATTQGQAQVVSIPDVAGATGNFLVSKTASGTQAVVGTMTFNANPVTVTAVITAGQADLAAAGKVNIWVAPSVTAQIAIIDIKVLKSTGLSGGGGDRLLAVSDGTIVFNNAGITAALLGTPILTVWGGTGNPLAVGASEVSTAGANVFLQYSGGAADYNSGSVMVAITYAQVTA